LSDHEAEQVIQDLRKSLAWLDLALATLNEGVLVLDGSMKTLFANDALAAMVNKQRILLLGTAVWDNLQLYSNDRLLSGQDYKKMRQKNLSGTYELRNGSSHVIVELSVAHIPTTKHTVLVVRDVTERLQAQLQRVRIAQEQAAREAAEVSEQRVLLQYRVASVLAGTLERREALQEILKIVCNHLEWKSGALWALNDDGDRLRALASWATPSPKFRQFIATNQQLTFAKGEGLPGRAWKKGGPVWLKDVSTSSNFPRQSAAKKTGLHSAFAIPLHNGKDFVGVIEFFSDRIQKPDIELLTSMATVGMQIAEYIRRKSIERTTLSLREQKDRLLEISNAKDEFISLASHQLRTPATGVKQFIGMLVEGYGGALTQTQSMLAQKAFDSNERQIAIVNDLLKVAQIDAGKVTLDKEDADLIPIMKSIIEEQADKFKQRQQRVSFSADEDKIKAPIDTRNFRMALENIVDNASKYTEPGKNISVTLRQSGGFAMIAVKDEGVGIDKEDIPKIFDKFSRVTNPLSVVVGGTGLGLYWCRKIIELHGGKIDVTSVPGKGTTFTISTPL
jgi:signal transduction histidine kinase